MHINLIYEDEQRGASPVSLWLLARVAMGTLAFFMVFGIVMFTIGYRSIKQQVNTLDTEWIYTEPKYKAAIQVRKNQLIHFQDVQMRPFALTNMLHYYKYL